MLGIGSAISLGSGLLGGLTSNQKAAAGGLGLIAVLLPIIIGIGGYIHGQAQYNDGVESQQQIIKTLRDEKNKLITDLAAVKSDLSACRAENEVVSKNNRELQGQIKANQDAHIAALEAERQSTKAAQEATRNAVNALALARTDNSNAFNDIRAQLEGLFDGEDENGNRCIVRGGARILRNARVGKAQN